MSHDDTGAVLTVEPQGDIYHKLGSLTRQLHDTLGQLGVIPALKDSFDSLPDAKSRLTYIAEKTGDAAEKVLNLVDKAKAEHAHISAETRRVADQFVADPVKAVASGQMLNFVGDVEASTARIDQHLTDIMMAQDFHDLTGQVVAKVVTLVTDIEQQLVKILIDAAPAELPQRNSDPLKLEGPVVDTEGRTDVVSNQGEVDDLLASLGF